MFSLDSLGVNYTDGVTVRISEKYTVRLFLCFVPGGLRFDWLNVISGNVFF